MYEDEEFYYVYAIVDVIPDVDFELALNMMAEPAAQSMVTLFSGMFE